MKRKQFDQLACNSVADCVKEIEQTTDVELVIVVRARSASYAHADYLFGAVLAFAGLLFLVFAPIDFHEYWVPVDVALLFLLGALTSSRSNMLRRLFTRRKFQAAACRTSAAAMFYEAGIANTTNERGVLVYLSLLERQLEVIADRGVLKAVPPLKWNEILFELHQAGGKPEVATLLKVLRKFGALLAKHLPATGENPNELPDMPRFEL